MAFCFVVSARAQTSSDSFLDQTHQSISESVYNTAVRLDGFFIDELAQDEQVKSQLRVRPTFDIEMGGNFKASMPARVSLVLPNLNDRWEAFATSDSTDEAYVSSDAFSQTSPNVPDRSLDDNHSELGFSYIDRTEERRDLRYSIAAKFRGGKIDPYVSIRYRFTQPLGEWQGRLVNKAYYFLNDGFEAQIRADLDRHYNENGLLRITSSVDWLEREEGYRFNEQISYRQLLSDISAAAIGWNMQVFTEPTFQVDSHILFVEYRRQFWRDWLFYQISPQVRFQKENDFNPQAALVVSLDILFSTE